MVNKTTNRYPISSLIENRWSTRAFSGSKVEEGKLNSILEAGLWAASAFNEQPWRFIVGRKGSETYDKILSTLVEWNQRWAGKAGVLVLNIAKNTFTHNNKPNATCNYDLGQAAAFMSIEAVNQGLCSHQMSGFDAQKAAEIFNINRGYNIVSVTAIGYYGDAEELPADMQKSENEERSRKNFNTMVFTGKFEN
ncbi:MAG: nitroreductase family protein [Chlorobi bacterium]|nr:nitroreductase family protein [Chlorobiota bacterium]